MSMECCGKAAPRLRKLEQVTLSWLRQWMGLAQEFFGIIYDTASISSMHAIAAAREMADPEVRTRGNSGRLVMYTSEHAHSSIEKRRYHARHWAGQRAQNSCG